MNTDFQYFSQRGYGLRIIMIGDVIAFGALLSTSEFFTGHGRAKFYYGVVVAIDLVALIVVAQTRAILIGLVFAVLIGYLVTSKKGKALRALLIAAVAFAFLLFGFQDFLNSLYSDNLVFSTVARSEAYTFYLSHMFDNGVVGIGLIPTDSSFYSLYGSTYTRGGISDIGIAGYFSSYGMLGVIVFVVVAVGLLTCMFKRDTRSEMMIRYPEVYILITYYFTTSLTLSLSNPQRVFFLPVLLAMVSYAFSQVESKLGHLRPSQAKG